MFTLKILRLLHGKSQWALSVETHIPNYRLSLLENGKAEPHPDELLKLADALNTTTDLLQRDVCKQLLEGGWPV